MTASTPQSHRPTSNAARAFAAALVVGITIVLTTATAFAADPGISPNSTGVPGIGSFREIAGGLATAALIACGVGLIISSVIWAIGSNTQNMHHTQKGKSGVLISMGAALLIGGVNLIIAFWNNLGSALH